MFESQVRNVMFILNLFIYISLAKEIGYKLHNNKKKSVSLIFIYGSVNLIVFCFKVQNVVWLTCDSVPFRSILMNPVQISFRPHSDDLVFKTDSKLYANFKLVIPIED